MTTRRDFVWSYSFRIAMALLLISTFGCAGHAWRQAVKTDTPAAYYEFMRDHGESKYVESARERLDFHKLMRNPTLSGFERFQTQYPNSELSVALHPAIEKPAFEAARAGGTAAAYRSFLETFPGGSYEARARGNIVYTEAEGFGGSADALARFAKEHPESDFAAEAERTAKATAARRAARFNEVGLVLSISRSTPEAKRVRQALLGRIEKLTERMGLRMVQVPSNLPAAQLSRYPQARIEVSHDEVAVESEVNSSGVARPSILGTTKVVFKDKQGGAVIASREFSVRVVDKDHVPGTSVLFSAAGPKYWEDFFVPTALWRNDYAIRPPIVLGESVVDVDAAGDRAAVLYENGNFELLGLADPTQPVKLVSYRRGEDYKRWSGVKLLGNRVAIFGEEGLELVRFTRAGPKVENTWDRGQIGRVLAITMVGDQLVTVGAKGMQIVDAETGQIKKAMRRVIQGIDSTGDVLVFADGETVYISSLKLLTENRVIAQMKLGRTFGPQRVRVLDSAAIITGPGGALVIDVRNPRAPKALAKLSSREVGEISDATRVRGRTFLVGKRGALLLSRQLSSVEETIDVGNRNRVAVMGRHLVMTDSTGVQVVDAAPWAEQAAPAAPRTQRPDALLNGSGF